VIRKARKGREAGAIWGILFLCAGHWATNPEVEAHGCPRASLPALFASIRRSTRMTIVPETRATENATHEPPLGNCRIIPRSTVPVGRGASGSAGPSVERRVRVMLSAKHGIASRLRGRDIAEWK
jgi:hypothetical protein